MPRPLPSNRSPLDAPVGPPLIGALLRVPWEAVRRRMLTDLNERGFDDLVAAHLNVLQYPGPDGARPSELAGRLRITKQALNYLLRDLERLGYLERRDDPEDRRSRRIALTARGTDAVRQIRRTVGEIEREWERRLGSERFALLRSALVELGSFSADR